MSFSITLRNADFMPSIEEFGRWLTEESESFDLEENDCFVLRGLELQAKLLQESVKIELEIETTTPLTRAIDLIFSLSVRMSSVVCLDGIGEATRANTWLLFADEQDRLRIVAALAEGIKRGVHDEMCQRLWALLATLGEDELHWDKQALRILPPSPNRLHIVACRWMQDVYPAFFLEER